MTHDLEFAQIELQVLEGLKNGNEALKKVHAALDIADIEKIMDETREGAEKQEEINQLLSGALTEEDEAAVEAELDEILEQQLPNVPSEELPSAKPESPVQEEKGKGKDRSKSACFIV